jgi:hypothetical protein
MEFENLVRGGLDYFSAHPYVAIAILAVVAVAAYFKFKLVIKMIMACLILAAIAYVLIFLINLTSTGIDNTGKLRDSPSEAIDK